MNYGYAADGSSLNPADMGGVSMPLDGAGAMGAEAVSIGVPELEGTEGGYQGAAYYAFMKEVAINATLADGLTNPGSYAYNLEIIATYVVRVRIPSFLLTFNTHFVVREVLEHQLTLSLLAYSFATEPLEY